jgi:6-phosphofructokinase 1
MLPEEEMSIDELVEILEKGEQRKKTSSIVIVAEGDANGGAYQVAKKVNEKYSYYETKVTVLGHIQRGGAPSCLDRVIASRMGVHAVEGLLGGKTDVMAGIINDEDVYTPFSDAISKKSKLNEEQVRMSRILSI